MATNTQATAFKTKHENAVGKTKHILADNMLSNGQQSGLIRTSDLDQDKKHRKYLVSETYYIAVSKDVKNFAKKLKMAENILNNGKFNKDPTMKGDDSSEYDSSSSESSSEDDAPVSNKKTTSNKGKAPVKRVPAKASSKLSVTKAKASSSKSVGKLTRDDKSAPKKGKSSGFTIESDSDDDSDDDVPVKKPISKKGKKAVVESSSESESDDDVPVKIPSSKKVDIKRAASGKTTNKDLAKKSAPKKQNNKGKAAVASTSGKSLPKGLKNQKVSQPDSDSDEDIESNDDSEDEATPLNLKNTDTDELYFDNKASELPELKNFKKLDRLTIKSDILTDSNSKVLESLKTLTFLDVSDCQIGDSTAVRIAKLPNLVELNISKTQIGVVGLKAIAKSGVKKLSFGIEDLDSSHVNVICGMKLSQLSLGFETELGIKSSDIKVLTGMSKTLTELSLECCDVNNDVIDILLKLTKLEALNLSSTKVTIKGIRRLTKLNQLSRLHVGHLKLTNDDITAFSEFNLTTLSLAGNFIGSGDCGKAGIDGLLELDELLTLNLEATAIDDDSIEVLKQMKLNRLMLKGCDMSDIGLKKMQGVKKIKSVEF